MFSLSLYINTTPPMYRKSKDLQDHMLLCTFLILFREAPLPFR